MMSKQEEKNLIAPTNFEPWANNEHIGKKKTWHSNKVVNLKSCVDDGQTRREQPRCSKNLKQIMNI